jgi:hypothetical protein
VLIGDRLAQSGPIRLETGRLGFPARLMNGCIQAQPREPLAPAQAPGQRVIAEDV